MYQWLPRKRAQNFFFGPKLDIVWCWDVAEKPLIHLVPVNSWDANIGVSGGMIDWVEDTSNIFPEAAKFWMDHLHLLPPSLCPHPLGIIGA